VHLADRGGRHRRAVERNQPVPPAAPVGVGEVSRDDPLGDPGRHGRHSVGEPPQRRPVRRRHLLRHRRLEYRHRLPQLGCPALEFAKGGEQLRSGARGDLIGGGAGQSAGGGNRARGMAYRQYCQPAAAPQRTGRQDRPFPPAWCFPSGTLRRLYVDHPGDPPWPGWPDVCWRFAARRRHRRRDVAS
jgi:hypothetical protein